MKDTSRTVVGTKLSLLKFKGNKMITLKEWMEVVDYRITEGSNYLWDCYGPDSYSLDSWNGEQEGHSFTVIFDTKTQVVYEVQSHDYKNQRAYRRCNPEYQAAMETEAGDRMVNKKQAWEDVDYVDLESDDDWIQKAIAIASGEDYDTRVTIPLDLDDDILLQLMKMAHERDLTFNEFIEGVLREQLGLLTA
jgi:hypothetical protein